VVSTPVVELKLRLTPLSVPVQTPPESVRETGVGVAALAAETDENAPELVPPIWNNV
jgi:hypothetical protein